MNYRNRLIGVVLSMGLLTAILGGIATTPVAGKSKDQVYYFKNMGHSVYLSVNGDTIKGTEKKSSRSEWILVPAKNDFVYIQSKKSGARLKLGKDEAVIVSSKSDKSENCQWSKIKKDKPGKFLFVNKTLKEMHLHCQSKDEYIIIVGKWDGPNSTWALEKK